MSGSRIITLALLFACHSSSSAQRVAAIDYLLKPIISGIAADPNVGGWKWETNRNGGYLLRTMMDVTGDGKPEVFIASTLESGRFSHEWHVFDVADKGRLRPYRESVNFRFAQPIKEDGEVSLVYFAGSNRELAQAGKDENLTIIRFSFSYPEIRRTTSYVDEDEEAAQLRIAETNPKPGHQAILLADYLMDPNAEWASMDGSGTDINDCFFLEASKERAERNTDFTPQVAMTRLGSMQPSPPREKKHGNTIAPVVDSRQPSDQTRLEEKEATSSKKPNSPTPWLVALMAAAIGLLGYWFKRSKTTGG